MPNVRPALLLHACCAPCTTHPVRLLSNPFEVTVFWYNPNIQPESEYDARRTEIELLAYKWGFPCIIGEYDSGPWTDRIRGHEQDPEGGARCSICFRFRLERTARAAREKGFSAFSTTLSVSSHKNADLINRIGKEIETDIGIRFFEADFKKKDGSKIAGMLSREEGLYRQDYCGCLYSRKIKS